VRVYLLPVIMGLRTIVYNRKSTRDEDEKQINSLHRQKEDTDEYFARQERAETNPEKKLIWSASKDIDWFFEDASAKVVGRKKFNEMLALIHKNKFEILWCFDLTRLSRNAFDTAQLVQLLEPYDNKGNTHLREIRTLDKIFTTSPTDRFMLVTFLNIAKYENDQRAENVKSGMQYIRKQGGTTSKAPVGYLNQGDKQGQKYVIKDPSNFSKCKELWKMFLSEAYTLKQIYQRKDELGIYHFYSGSKRLVANTTIRNMFTKQYYAGKLPLTDEQTGETIWIEGKHPVMIMDAEFQKAQCILQKMGHRHAKIDRAYDVGDLIKCVAVSGIITFEKADGSIVPAPVIYEKRTRLTCSKCKHRFYSPHTSCSKCKTDVSKNTVRSEIHRFYHSKDNRKSVSLKKVLLWLSSELNKITISDELFQIFKERLYYRWLEKEKRYKQALSRFNKKIRKLDDELSNLKRKKFDPQVSDTDKKDIPFAVTKTQEDKIEQVDAREKLQEEHEEEFDMAWHRLQVLHDAKDILSEQGEFEPKKAIFLSLCSNLKLYPDKIKLTLIKPFDTVAKMNIDRTQNSRKTTNAHRNTTAGAPNMIMFRTIVRRRINSYSMPVKINGHSNWKEEVRLMRTPKSMVC